MSRELSAKKIAKLVDGLLCDFYREWHQNNIEDFIFFADDPTHSKLAETLIDHSPLELSISVRISPALLDCYLHIPCPTTALRHDNIGLFSVIAEEVSHFHEICRVAENVGSITRFDLELQSEFDKYIAALILAEQQTGSIQSHPIARLMFDSSVTYSQDLVYDRAGDIAASWWWGHINIYGDDLLKSPEFVKCLRHLRGLQGETKLDFLKSASGGGLKRVA